LAFHFFCDSKYEILILIFISFENYIDVKEYITSNNLKPVQVEVPLPTANVEPASAVAVQQTQSFTASPVKTLTSTADYEDIELSTVRKVIAKRLLFSKVFFTYFFNYFNDY
jgi:hypothetical protein